jgi:hypothetical protein
MRVLEAWYHPNSNHPSGGIPVARLYFEHQEMDVRMLPLGDTPLRGAERKLLLHLCAVVDARHARQYPGMAKLPKGFWSFRDIGSGDQNA